MLRAVQVAVSVGLDEQWLAAPPRGAQQLQVEGELLPGGHDEGEGEAPSLGLARAQQCLRMLHCGQHHVGHKGRVGLPA